MEYEWDDHGIIIGICYCIFFLYMCVLFKVMGNPQVTTGLNMFILKKWKLQKLIPEKMPKGVKPGW